MLLDVGLVTYTGMLSGAEDDAPLLQALVDSGLRVGLLPWDDAGIAWGEVGVTVIRSPWDYHLRCEEFLAWVARAERATELWNRAETVRWNSRKTYLRDLDARGVAVIPTVWAGRGEEVELARVMCEHGWGEVVVKPVVSLSAYGTMRVRADNMEEGQAHLARLLEEREMMVQPYIASVEGYGERSLVYIDGSFSHAVRRSPALSHAPDDEWATTVTPAPEEISLADAVMQAAGADTLYARVDIVRDDAGEPRLMELELVEPSLFFLQAPQAAVTMAEAIERRLAGRR